MKKCNITESDKCGICKSDNIQGGSWAPDRCLNCGAMESGEWYYDYKVRPTIAEIQKKSGFIKVSDSKI